MADTVLLFGGSVRALAESVLRAGLTPLCYDLFADWDLRQVCCAVAIDRRSYPAAFLEMAQRRPGVPWMYAGGLENHPDLLNQIASSNPLWGNDGQTVRRVRDPFRLQSELASTAYEMPETRKSAIDVPTDGSWLTKPYRGTGGMGIRRWHGEAEGNGCYWQKWVSGTPRSALFLATTERVSLLGLTDQLIGSSFLHAAPFQYSGTLATNADLRSDEDLVRCGTHLVRRLGLRGLFGIDFIETEGKRWILEVNPRYTAAAEVLEELTGLSLIAAYLGQERWNPLRAMQRSSSPSDSAVAKGVLFAKSAGYVPAGTAIYRRGWQGDVRYADLPTPESRFARGEPILTLIVRGTNRHEVLEKLKAEVLKVERDSLEFTQ